ncbi:Glutamate receptor ionotropic kainate 3 [Schistosoma japonicum]|nr:Glutamate receptor ionotropic kainate 3 [Schistosoma japonicum]
MKDDNNEPVEYEQEIKNTLHNGLEQAAESEASERLRCYRRQLLMSLSSRLQLPLVTITDLEECPGSMIDSAIKWFSFSKSKHRSGSSHQRISNPYSPALVHSIGPSQFLVAELLKNLIILNEEIWKGFAIVYEHSGDFLKYRECLESLQTTALIRRWRDNSFYKAHIIREIKHLEAFFLDLSAKSIEQFFQMASFNYFLSFTKYISMGSEVVEKNEFTSIIINYKFRIYNNFKELQIKLN